MINKRLEMITEWANSEWDISQVYDPAFISKKFKLTNRESRYYAGKLVDSGILCKVKVDGFIYYVKACWFVQLRKYNALDDVKIT
jgi:hypothetical protein